MEKKLEIKNVFIWSMDLDLIKQRKTVIGYIKLKYKIYAYYCKINKIPIENIYIKMSFSFCQLFLILYKYSKTNVNSRKTNIDSNDLIPDITKT